VGDLQRTLTGDVTAEDGEPAIRQAHHWMQGQDSATTHIDTPSRRSRLFARFAGDPGAEQAGPN
jgi:hypothetical protein